MKRIFGLMSFTLFALLSACRDSRFEREAIGLEQNMKNVGAVEGEYRGECAGDKKNCFITQLKFQLKSNRGQELTQIPAELTAQHPKVISKSTLNSISDDRGFATFEIEIEEFSFERGQQIVVGLELNVPRWGKNFYCAKLEPSNSKSPLIDISICDPSTFKAVTFRAEPQWMLKLHEVVLSRDPQKTSASAELWFRARFQLKDRLRDQVASGFKVTTQLRYRKSDVRHESISDDAGYFDFEFSLPYSAYENEHRALVVFESSWGTGEKDKSAGYFVLNLENASGNAVVVSNFGPAPAEFESQKRYGPVSAEVTYAKILSGPEYSATPSFRIFQEHEIELQIQFFIHRANLLGESIRKPLHRLAVLGKVFFVGPVDSKQTGQVLSEHLLNGELDANGALAMRLRPQWTQFSIPHEDVDIVVAAALPELPESPIFYQRFQQSIERGWSSFAIREAEATDLLRAHLIDLKEPLKGRAEPALTREEIFKKALNLETTDFLGGSENQKRILNLLQKSTNRDSDMYWKEILTLFNTSPLPKGAVRGPVDALVREYIFPYSEVRVSNSRVTAESWQGLDGERLSLDFEGSGIRCTRIEIANPKADYFYCPSNPEAFSVSQHWLRLNRSKQSAVLLRPPMTKVLSAEELNRLDQFQHPELHRTGVLMRVLWPSSIKDQ